MADLARKLKEPLGSLHLNDFTEQTLQLEDDYEGRVVATLIRSPLNKPKAPSVLYLHGYNDYFFHAHVAKAFHKAGYNFYALDLRKYGRSLLAHQHPNYCRSLDEYFEEIDLSLEIIRNENPDQELHVLGHSTGGLISSLYQNKGRYAAEVDALILNSPFLEFNATPWQRTLVRTFSEGISRFMPFASKNKPLSHLYGKSLWHEDQGEWLFNTDWKPRSGFPAYLKWVSAIFEGQEYLKSHSSIEIPVLILHSDKSVRHRNWNDEISRADMVLNVEHMKERGKNLGGKVDFLEVENAIHDIFLSAPKVRHNALEGTLKWLKG